MAIGQLDGHQTTERNILDVDGAKKIIQYRKHFNEIEDNYRIQWVKTTIITQSQNILSGNGGTSSIIIG